MPGLTPRLVDVLGTRLENVDEAAIGRLVENGVREDADLDFKQDRYGNSDSQKRELAADIAAMANHRGGLIVIGLRDEGDTAAERTPVELDQGEEARIRLVAAGNIAPHVPFEVCVVESHERTGSGYYLIAIPPSSMRPHAVRKDHDLRYPRRDGTTKRWLSEAEVADFYRDRFRGALDQTERVASVVEEGLRAMDTSGDEAFVAIGLVPTTPGSMPIDLARVNSVEEWAKSIGRPFCWTGFFGHSPRAGVGTRRVAVGLSLDANDRPNYNYAEFHSDGAGFACSRLPDPRRNWTGQQEPCRWVDNETLLLTIARALGLLGRHAINNAGCSGDCLVEARLVEPPLRLVYPTQFQHPEPVAGGRVIEGTVASRHTLLLEALAGRDRDLLASARLVATDMLQTFGSPEVRHVTADGKLRIRYFHGDTRQLRALAERRQVELTDEAVPGD